MGTALSSPLLMASNTVVVEKFGGATKCRDVIWAVLFVAQTITITVLGIMGTVAWSNNLNIEGVNSQVLGDSSAILAICLAIAIVWCFLWMVLLRVFAGCLVYTALALSFAVGIGLLVYSIQIVFWAGIIINSIWLVLLLVWVWFCWRRIAFTTALLKATTVVYSRLPMAAFLGQFSLVPLLLYIWLWCGTIFYTNNSICNMVYAANPSADCILVGTWQFWLYNILLLISFIWGTQVVVNVVFTSSAGTVASWYFSDPKDLPSFSVAKSLYRACTVSFGSICFGSLLVAIIKAFVDLVKIFTSEKAQTNCCLRVLFCCINSCLRGLEWLAQLFNEFALVQVAVYNKSFLGAAKDTMALMASSGVSAIITESLTDHVLWIGTILGGVITGCSGYFIADSWIGSLSIPGFDDTVHVSYMVATIAALLGIVITSATQRVIGAGVTTIFVCYAEEPLQLEQHHPELFEKFVRVTGENPGDSQI